MKKFKGTPGTWFVSDCGDVYNHSNKEDAVMVAAVAGFERSKQDEANAKLIAAAPELLEALRQMRDYAEDVLAVSLADCDPEHPMMLATSAINKALGE